jgi:hypothetical protein
VATWTCSTDRCPLRQTGSVASLTTVVPPQGPTSLRVLYKDAERFSGESELLRILEPLYLFYCLPTWVRRSARLIHPPHLLDELCGSEETEFSLRFELSLVEELIRRRLVRERLMGSLIGVHVGVTRLVVRAGLQVDQYSTRWRVFSRTATAHRIHDLCDEEELFPEADASIARGSCGSRVKHGKLLANGKRYHHPEAESFARILRFGHPHELHFNDRSDFTGPRLSKAAQEEHGYRAMTQPPSALSLEISL